MSDKPWLLKEGADRKKTYWYRRSEVDPEWRKSKMGDWKKYINSLTVQPGWKKHSRNPAPIMVVTDDEYEHCVHVTPSMREMAEWLQTDKGGLSRAVKYGIRIKDKKSGKFVRPIRLDDDFFDEEEDEDYVDGCRN